MPSLVGRTWSYEEKRGYGVIGMGKELCGKLKNNANEMLQFLKKEQEKNKHCKNVENKKIDKSRVFSLETFIRSSTNYRGRETIMNLSRTRRMIAREPRRYKKSLKYKLNYLKKALGLLKKILLELSCTNKMLIRKRFLVSTKTGVQRKCPITDG